jgi:hypothetical protein
VTSLLSITQHFELALTGAGFFYVTITVAQIATAQMTRSDIAGASKRL